MDLSAAHELNCRFKAVVPNHIDILFSLSEPVNGRSEVRGFGSCVHVTYKDQQLTITCNHVAVEGGIYFTNPKKLTRPLVPEGPLPLVHCLPILGRWQAQDLVVFNSDKLPMEQHGKTRFDLSKSNVVTHDLLSGPKGRGLASYIYGVWGEHTSVYPYPDGLAYMEVITYSGLGPIVEVTENVIVTDHAEKHILEREEAASAKIKDFVPSGGYRDISGCSGSGLWIMGNEPILAGILCRRRQASCDKHLIEFTPVWQVLEMVDKILTGKPLDDLLRSPLLCPANSP